MRLLTCNPSAVEIAKGQQYAQNDDLNLCIHPTETTPDRDSYEVLIQIFQLTLISDSVGAVYESTTMGASTWVAGPFSEVSNLDTSNSRLLIKFSLATQLFDLDPGTVQTITIIGRAHLEFRRTNE